jgi:hypothetical protein
MENKSFYIRYQQNQPLNIETHIDAARKTRENPLVLVGHLIEAYKYAVAPRFDNTPGDEITLHQVVDGVESVALLPDIPLTEIHGGQSARDPLIIKTLNSNNPTNLIVVPRQSILDAGKKYDWEYLSSLFGPIEEFKEVKKHYYTDRDIKFRTKKPLTSYEHRVVNLLKENLPDLKYQTFTHLKTTIQSQVDDFMTSNIQFLGLLIGPTGCGKTHQMIHLANNNFTIFINAQELRGSNEPMDSTLTRLKENFEKVTNSWKRKNQDLPELRRIAYAFF